MTYLRDYKWYIAGEYQVAPDLTLNDAYLTCSFVEYETLTRSANVQLCFTEGTGIFKNYRSISLQLADGDESLDTDSIVLFITSAYPTAVQVEPPTP